MHAAIKNSFESSRNWIGSLILATALAIPSVADSPPSPNPAAPAPARVTKNVADLKAVIILTLSQATPAADAAAPQLGVVVTATDGSKRETKLNDVGPDNAPTHPLRDVLRAARKQHGEGLRVLIDADPALPYGAAQRALQELAIVAQVEFGFVSRTADDDGDAKPSPATYLPASMPVHRKPKAGEPQPAVPVALDVFLASAEKSNGRGEPHFRARLGAREKEFNDSPTLRAALEALRAEAARAPAETSIDDVGNDVATNPDALRQSLENLGTTAPAKGTAPKPAAGARRQPIVALIRPSAATRYADVLAAYQAALEAGYDNVYFGAAEK